MLNDCLSSCKNEFDEAQSNNKFSVPQMLTILSQFCKLENTELNLAEQAIEAIGERYDEIDSSLILPEKRHTGVIATARRALIIANSIAKVLVKSIQRIFRGRTTIRA